MLTMMFIIAFASTTLEMMIVWKAKGIRKLVQKNIFFGLAMSLIITVGMSTLFGSSGTIVAGAAFVSIMLSFAIYNLRLIELLEITIEGTKRSAVIIKHHLGKLGTALRATRTGWRRFRHPLAYKRLYG